MATFDWILFTPRWVPATILLSIVASLGAYLNKRKHRHSMPPGPPVEPIIGCLRHMPTKNVASTIAKWSKDYNSDVVSVTILGQPLVFLNSKNAATDLLVRRGANYSSRPKFTLYRIMGWKKNLALHAWGDEFRRYRRAVQKSFQANNIMNHRPMQEQEIARMLLLISEKPGRWKEMIRRATVAIIVAISSGLKVKSEDDPVINMASGVSEVFNRAGAPGMAPVDFFPVLRFLPSWLHDKTLKIGTASIPLAKDFHNLPYEAGLASPVQTEFMTQKLLDQRREQIEKGQNHVFSIDDIKGMAATVLSAGNDTTWATTIVFVLNMVLNPDVQAKAQMILDKEVGRNRLPTLEDRSKLRYIEYILQETLRWSPVTPFGIPHCSMVDDFYKGHFIPGGSYVFANPWAMTHDEEVYSKPDDFNPDRYTPSEEGGPGEPFPAGPFGFGRRVCPGKALGESNVWLSIACLLSVMNFEKERDQNGRPVEPQWEYIEGLTTYPHGFECHIQPRDEKSISMLSKIRGQFKD